MNIYDFDNTIYKGDSSIDFFKYSLKKHPSLVFKRICKTFPMLFKYIFNKCTFKEIKESLYLYIKDINDLEEFVNEFVNSFSSNIKEFYKKNQEETDLIVSASYELWLLPLCQKVGIKNVIGTKVNLQTGKIIGFNCKGKEKIQRIKNKYGNIIVKNAYSDSKSDIPMLELATEKSYFVKGENLILYKNKNVNK